MPASPWRWFGVKTVFRTAAGAAPHDGPTLVEERIVLLRARTPAEAIRVGERDALAYQGEPFHNAAGVEMRRRYLGACTAYELFDEDTRRLGDARGTIEVFSDTELVAGEVPDAEVVARLGGADGERDTRWSHFVPRDLVERYGRG
jgi:hypothetical protein